MDTGSACTVGLLHFLNHAVPLKEVVLDLLSSTIPMGYIWQHRQTYTHLLKLQPLKKFTIKSSFSQIDVMFRVLYKSLEEHDLRDDHPPVSFCGGPD